MATKSAEAEATAPPVAMGGQMKDAIRALLAVLEAGSLNSEQRVAIHHVRVVIGDAEGSGCPHELTVYEEGDRLICQACREDLTPEAKG